MRDRVPGQWRIIAWGWDGSAFHRKKDVYMRFTETSYRPASLWADGDAPGSLYLIIDAKDGGVAFSGYNTSSFWINHPWPWPACTHKHTHTHTHCTHTCRYVCFLRLDLNHILFIKHIWPYLYTWHMNADVWHTMAPTALRNDHTAICQATRTGPTVLTISWQ